MCFHMFVGLKLGVKTLPFTLHRHWKKEKVTEFMCVCLRRSSSGLIESDRFVESGKCFYPWDSRWGRWRGRWWKKEEEKNAKLSVILQMQGHFLVFLYTNFHSSICSIFQSQYQYRVIHNDWRLLRTFRFVEVVMSSHEHKLIGAFHLLLLDRTVNMPLIISE